MSPDKLRIMVLDDEPIVCKRLKPALEKLGYEVDAFTQSPEAMQQIQRVNYDIVITGFATMETAKQSFQKGVFDFIAKPFKLSEIQEVVNRAANKIRGSAA